MILFFSFLTFFCQSKHFECFRINQTTIVSLGLFHSDIFILNIHSYFFSRTLKRITISTTSCCNHTHNIIGIHNTACCNSHWFAYGSICINKLEIIYRTVFSTSCTPYRPFISTKRCCKGLILIHRPVYTNRTTSATVLLTLAAGPKL